MDRGADSGTRTTGHLKEWWRMRQWLGHLLTKCTAVGRTVDLDAIAENHQVGGHLRALVCLHFDVLPILIEREFLQVAHPLTCMGGGGWSQDQEVGGGWQRLGPVPRCEG